MCCPEEFTRARDIVLHIHISKGFLDCPGENPQLTIFPFTVFDYGRAKPVVIPFIRGFPALAGAASSVPLLHLDRAEENELQLDRHRLLAPQGPAVVKSRNSFVRMDEVSRAFLGHASVPRVSRDAVEPAVRINKDVTGAGFKPRCTIWFGECWAGSPCLLIRPRTEPQSARARMTGEPPLTIKEILKHTPVLGPLLVRIRPDSFKSSNYWDQRYKTGGNSGPGSYNRLAEFKANFLNEFVDKNQITSVIEFGSGDGSQLKLARYPKYIGADVSSTAVDMCRSIFAGDPSKTFFQSDALKPGTAAELSLSLDVIYHLVEDWVFEAYMGQLFASASRFVIVYSSNMSAPRPATHVKHREFTKWVNQNQPAWLLQSTVPNLYPFDPADPVNTSFADFYIFERR
jgi:hypothetical protein